MKTLFTTTALILATAIPALAMTSAADTLSTTERGAVLSLSPNADVDNLTVAQVSAIRSNLHNGDDTDQRRNIRAIVR